MQVAKAGKPTSAVGTVPARDESYAPLYLTSVLGNVSFDIDEMEAFALARLRLLRATGEASGNSHAAEVPDVSRRTERSETIRRAEREHGFHIPPPGNVERQQVIVRDQAAHYLVRLALCTTLEGRQWFLARECALFCTRLEGSGTEYALQSIRDAQGPDIKRTPSDVLHSIRPDLDAVARGSRSSVGDMDGAFYQIAFEHVPALVRTRRVFVRNGFAYVPARNVQDIVVAQFRSLLNGALVTAMKAVGLAEQDSRMRKILLKIREHYAAVSSTKRDFDVDGLGVDRISLNQLKESVCAMPLCMQNLMGGLRANHHLRHGGRMQLGVFLKGCGLTMEESLRFWREEFCNGGMSADKFDKQYAYNIRHHYGKEGKRSNLPPFSCMKIINNRPGPGEHHGCPYREFEHNRLRESLRHAGAPVDAISSIVAKAAEGNFQGSCGLCFAATQPGPHEKNEAGTPAYFPEHPNDYFIQARRKRFAPTPEVDRDEDAEAMEEDMPALDPVAMETPEKTAITSRPSDLPDKAGEGNSKVNEIQSNVAQTDEHLGAPQRIRNDASAVAGAEEVPSKGVEDAHAENSQVKRASSEDSQHCAVISGSQVVKRARTDGHVGDAEVVKNSENGTPRPSSEVGKSEIDHLSPNGEDDGGKKGCDACDEKMGDSDAQP